MCKLSVAEVSKLSGVTIRTLHHYDKIGLLNPERTNAGYRFYDEKELIRLQQILFFKECDFSLKEIREIMDEKGFDMIDSLKNQKEALKDKQKRISTILNTIDTTIDHLQKGIIMKKPEMLYEGLSKEVGTSFRTEAIKKYGKEAIQKSEADLVKLGKEGYQSKTKEMNQITEELYTLRNENPESDTIQDLIYQHYSVIRIFWGTSDQSETQAEAYEGLGKIYIRDGRFLAKDGEERPDFSRFMAKAMKHFAKTRLK